MSIRTRLAIAVALVLLATLTVLGTVVVQSARATLVDQVDDEVRDFAARGEPPKGFGEDGRSDGRGSDGQLRSDADDAIGGGPNGDYAADLDPPAGSDQFERPVAYFLYSASGRKLIAGLCGFPDDPKPPPAIPAIPSAEINALVNRITTVPAEDGSLDYRMLVERTPGGQIEVMAAPLTEAEAAVSRLLRIVLLVGAAAMTAATLASWWLIRRGLRPVDRMVDTAAAIAAGDMSRRVPDADPRTELGRLGGALNDMLGRIERAIEARAASEGRLRRFVADAAHELRTPLTSLRGYAELYRQGAIPDERGVANAMGRIESEGARMARLVDDLLLLARLDQHRGLETKPVDVVALVQEAVADFGAVAPDRPVTQTVDGEAVVRGDRTRLRQVVDNLLANARTHTPPGTPVHVAVARTADQVEVSVRDEGPGIAPADQSRVFERFWRADPARVRSRGGSGLGLAIVASLVEAHGGAVAVASEPGHGATFTVRLPLAPPPPPSSPNAPQTARATPNPSRAAT